MEIISKAVSDLLPYDKNARNNVQSIDKVAKSIKKFGFKVPIVIDVNNVIICGHTRWEAAKKLEMKEVPCIVADDLTENQIKAYRLADNRTAEFSLWDFQLLNEELESIKDIDMDDFGFDMSFLDGTEKHEKEYENTSTEINPDNYEDEHFDHECPRCKFKFND